MRKQLVAVLIFITPLLSIAQAIEKGAIQINTGVGFGIYSVNSNIPKDSSDDGNGALPGIFIISGEYAITDKFGAVIRFQRNGYLTSDEDSLKARSINFMIGPSYHFINNDKFTMYGNFLLGPSTFKLYAKTEDGKKNNVYVKSKGGLMFQLNIGGSMYFSDNIGFFFETGYASHSHSTFTVHDDRADPKENDWEHNNDTPLDTSDDELVKVGLSGIDFRVGLALKF